MRQVRGALPPDDPLHEGARWFIGAITGELSSAERSQFARWLKQDVRHEETIRTISEMWQQFDAEATDLDLMALRREALRDARGARRFAIDDAKVPHRIGPILLAACLALAAVTSMVGFHPANEIYSTELGEQRVVTLPDDSKLWMEASTRLKAKYTDSQRKFVLEQGHARFRVAVDLSRPFIVSVKDHRVLALDSTFAVERTGNDLRIHLIDGRLDIQLQSTSEARPPSDRPPVVTLSPGGEVRIDLASGEIASSFGKHTAAWLRGP